MRTLVRVIFAICQPKKENKYLGSYSRSLSKETDTTLYANTFVISKTAETRKARVKVRNLLARFKSLLA